jgi:DNA-binding MurR/RpiR family transcriptional regulator
MEQMVDGPRARHYAARVSQTTQPQLAKRLEQRFDGLSPQMKKAAGYLMEHPADVALYSMREVAKRASIPPGTLLRLSSALGFDSYLALREVYRDGMKPQRAPFSDRARDLQRAARASSTAQLMARVQAVEIENIERTFSANDEATLERVVDLIERADTVYVLGQRSCFPAAFFFNYVLRLFRSSSVLIDSHGGAFVDELRPIGPRDLLVAISIQPYTAEVVRAAQFARKEGAKVLAITDSRVSPLRKAATESLLTVNRSASFFHSILAVLALVQGITALLAARGGDKTLAAIARSEKQLEWFHAYWSQENGAARG